MNNRGRRLKDWKKSIESEKINKKIIKIVKRRKLSHRSRRWREKSLKKFNPPPKTNHNAEEKPEDEQ